MIGAWAGEGQASARVTVSRAENTERGVGRWAADDGRCETEAWSQHAGFADTVWAWPSGKSKNLLFTVVFF